MVQWDTGLAEPSWPLQHETTCLTALIDGMRTIGIALNRAVEA
jgi:hypothetical protein